MTPSRRIRPLSIQLANQIAAGEVVERPASVLKELLENALDAGATRLEIEAEGGGVRLLRVRDDGGGIHPDDLGLALTRHATSKVTTAEELAVVTSLGFRGEALASIGSVARVRLTSRQAGDNSGWQVVADGGEVAESGASPVPAAHPEGTSVEVRELFFNTPARRKFLSAERTELGHLDEVVRRLALARPEVAVRFSHNGRERLRLASTAVLFERVEAVLGGRALAGARELSYQVPLGEERGERMSLRGWVAPTVGEAVCFINGRVIRDRLLLAALRRAAGDLGLDGPPTAVLYLAMPPELVDVNVHPAKSEVRFRGARDIHDALVTAVTNALRPVPADEPSAQSTPLASFETGGVAEPVTPALAGFEAAESMVPPAIAGPVLACWPEGFALLAGAPPRLLDCTAARAELYRRRLNAGLAGAGVPARRLLVPVLLPESAAVAVWERHGPLLQRLGVEWGPLEDGSGVRLLRLPDITAEAEPRAWLAALVAELADEASVDAGSLAERMATLAAHHPAAPLDAQRVAELVHALEGAGPLPEALVRPLDGTLVKALFG